MYITVKENVGNQEGGCHGCITLTLQCKTTEKQNLAAAVWLDSRSAFLWKSRDGLIHPRLTILQRQQQSKLPGKWIVALQNLKVVVVKGWVQRKATSAEGGPRQFISCGSTYCLPGRHSWCNTQLAQLHFITSTVSAGSTHRGFPDSPEPTSR